MKTFLTMIVHLLLTCSLGFTPALAEEVSLKHQDIGLRADLTIADGKSIEDGVVLLLHGTLAHHRMEIISTVAELLNDTGYNTLAINLSFALDKRAGGMLDCTIEHRHQHADAITELKAWMDWLKQQGATKVAAWGHSRGGNQAACFASQANPPHPLLSQMILVAPGSLDLNKEIEQYQQKHQTSLPGLISQARALIDAGKGDTLMSVPGFVYCENARVTAATFAEYLEETDCSHTPALLKQSTRPTLVVLGSEDTVVAGLAEQLTGLDNDKVQVVTIEGAGHFFRDLYADEMVEIIDGFLGW